MFALSALPMAAIDFTPGIGGDARAASEVGRSTGAVDGGPPPGVERATARAGDPTAADDDGGGVWGWTTTRGTPEMIALGDA